MHLLILQLDPIQPARQLHFTSVGLHVLHVEEQAYKQFWPWYPSLQARKKSNLIHNLTNDLYQI